MNVSELKAILQGLLFASDEPLTPQQLKKLLQIEGEGRAPLIAPPEGGGEQDPLTQLQEFQKAREAEISLLQIKEALGELMEEYRRPDHGFELVRAGEAFSFRTKVRLAPYIRNLVKLPQPRLSTPAMETLAVVAYQQPMTRTKIEEIRGVDSAGVLKTLLERNLIRVIGRTEVGRSLLYGTTPFFLETFGLDSLSALPPLESFDHPEESGVQAPSKGDRPPPRENEDFLLEERGEDYFARDEESDRLLSDLENSMASLKDLEHRIFPQKREEGEPPQVDREKSSP